MFCEFDVILMKYQKVIYKGRAVFQQNIQDF